MLAGKYTPDHGDIAVDGAVAKLEDRNVDHLYEKCGVAYCPQFDALFPKKTVKEHLKFYAAIRGLDWKEEAARHHIDAIVKLLGLKKHLDKESTALSGGYKRRLSLAISMIGYPNVLILDEITTGVDPGARRKIWDVLKPQSSHSDFDIPATILSSHYMDECQELGTRIGILIDGKISATGSLKRLQELFCTSYFVEVSLTPNAAEDAENKIIEVFERNDMDAESYESLPYRFKLRVPFVNGAGNDTTQQLATIFDLLAVPMPMTLLCLYKMDMIRMLVMPELNCREVKSNVLLSPEPSLPNQRLFYSTKPPLLLTPNRKPLSKKLWMPSWQKEMLPL